MIVYTKMKTFANISIIIPARNEEKVIIKTLESLKRKVNTSHEVIVIDDCSSDQTQKVVSAYIKNNHNVNLVKTVNGKSGFSNAIKKGMKKAKTNTIVIVMADLCDDHKTIDKMYKLINEGWDVVCGSRYMENGNKLGGPRLQGILSPLVCKTLYYLTGIPTKDASNAFKMYRKNPLNNLNFSADSGVELSMYLILQAFFKGYKITEIPTKWKGRTIGVSKFKFIERAPRFIKIYTWALMTSFRKFI